MITIVSDRNIAHNRDYLSDFREYSEPVRITKTRNTTVETTELQHRLQLFNYTAHTADRLLSRIGSVLSFSESRYCEVFDGPASSGSRAEAPEGPASSCTA